jgi:glycosyltransferase involved in cell wall biosynthesis
MRVMMIPNPHNVSGNLADGISQVVVNYARHLPEFDIELVKPDADDFDLIACHAGLTGEVNDVCHLHGLHWSGDYDAPIWEYRVNQRITEAVQHASQITVPSEWVAETIRRDLRVNPTVIPHGIDWADWQHDEPRGDYVLWNKNRHDDYVCDSSPVVKLANGLTRTHFVTTFLPKHVGPQDNINVIGLIPHEQMKRLVQSCIVYLSTTKETFGIGILEAMASGVPILGYAGRARRQRLSGAAGRRRGAGGGSTLLCRAPAGVGGQQRRDGAGLDLAGGLRQSGRSVPGGRDAGAGHGGGGDPGLQ